jgi:hypothetical protein
LIVAWKIQTLAHSEEGKRRGGTFTANKRRLWAVRSWLALLSTTAQGIGITATS